MAPHDRKKIIDPQMPAVILDLKGLITRSYHSGTDTHPVRDEETGERVNSASHGAANFLERVLLPILQDHAPINIIAAADGGNDLRRAVFPTYKQKRKERKEDEGKTQKAQIDLCLEQVTRLLVYLGCTAVKVEHREADDVIAALARGLGSRPKKIYTVDHDLIQLVNEDTNTWVIAFDEPKFTFIDKFESKGVKTYNEVEPGLVALYKSLVGDSSDEYGGVKGFGPVKWGELEDLLGTDGLYELDKMVATGDFTELQATVKAYPDLKILQMLLLASSEWRLMYYLAKLHPEACWGAVGKRLIKPVFTKRLPDRAKALQAMAALGVDDMIDHLEKWFPTMLLADEDNLEAAFDLVNRHLADGPVSGFDYEGYDPVKHAAFNEATKRQSGDYVDVLSQVVTGASICFGDNLQHTIYFPTKHKATKNIDKAYIPAVINEIQSHDLPLVIQNAGFEMTVTHINFGKDAAEIFRPHDTRVMASYFDENLMGEGKDGLKDLTWELLRYRQTEYKDLLERHNAVNMTQLTGLETLHYGCDDSLTACHLWVLFRWSLLLEGQWDFYLRHHTAPAHVMEKAFRTGLNIEWDELERLKAADQIVIDTNNKAIRDALEKHCQEPNLKAVEAFMAADEDALRYTLTEKWKKKQNEEKGPGRERMDALLSEVRMKHLEASVYKPYVEVKRTYEFKGTAAQLRDLTGELGFPELLDKDTNKAIQEWLTRWADEKLTVDQQEFLERLGLAAGKPLKSRSGPEFADLEEIAVKVMQRLMKSDWEGDELNYDSPQQMQQLLYCKLGLPVRRRSKVQRDSFRYERGFEGSPGTDKRAIAAALAEDCPNGDWRRDLLISLREVKAAMTRFELFWIPYPLWKHPLDGKVHPGVKDPGTVTRRPTSGKPNALQVSKGPTRAMFIPRVDAERSGTVDRLAASIAKPTGEAPAVWIPRLPKRLIMAPDFSGQELRITGSEANDPTLIQAYTGGKVYTDKYGVVRREVTDIHSLTTVKFAHRYVERELGASVLQYLPLGSDGRMSYEWYSKVRKCETPEQFIELLERTPDGADKLLKVLQDARGKMAKPTNFLITYLGTASTLAENTSMPEEFCKVVMDEVFASYARLGPWQEESIAFARKHGYVTTAYGTWKHLSEDILSSDRGLRSREERRACNQKIQGCAADVLHVVETDIYEREFLERYDTDFLLPVYDEIVLDVPLNDNLPALIAECAEIMDITPPGHAIPMMAEFSFGPNWYNQFELGERPCEKQVEEALSALFTPKEKKDAA